MLHAPSSFLRGCNGVIGLHHEFAEELVRGIDRFGVKKKRCSARVLFDQAQPELIVLEQMGAKIAHGHSLGLRALDQTTYRAVIKNNFQPVLVLESRQNSRAPASSICVSSLCPSAINCSRTRCGSRTSSP